MKKRSGAFESRVRKLRRDRRTSVRELARRVDEDSSFLGRVECGPAPESDEPVHRVAAELGVDARPLLVQVGHLPEDVRSLPAEHPQRVPDILQATFLHRGETVKLGQ